MTQQLIQKDEIRPELIKQLTKARRSIHLAIGWLEDSGLMGLLQKKALKGIDVKLMLIKEHDQQNTSNTLKQISKQGAKIIYLDDEHKEHLIDHKFVVIDKKTVLTGNYAWGYKNGPVEDELWITSSLPTMAIGYEEEFEYLSIVNQLSTTEKKPPNSTTDLLKKLSVVKVLLNIGDVEFIGLRLKELKAYRKDENVDAICTLLESENYEEALLLSKQFIKYHRPLRACIEPPIDNLRREMQRLEEEISATSNEYNETQKTLHRFSKMHSERLGDLLQKILLQSKIKAAREAAEDASRQEDYEAAKKDHEDYTESHALSKKQKLAVLSKQEQKELKKLYRQTSLKCHPDRVIDDFHDQAEQIFVELNQAYKANDLERVREISQQLKSGIMLAKSEGITELKKLESAVKSLSQKLEGWLEKLEDLKRMPSYHTISTIEDWEVYFEETRRLLENQLERLVLANEV